MSKFLSDEELDLLEIQVDSLSGFLPQDVKKMIAAARDRNRLQRIIENPGYTIQAGPPDVTPPGRLCTLCDSTAGCSHPKFVCTCGESGLIENASFHIFNHEGRYQ